MYKIIFTNGINNNLFNSIDRCKRYLNALYDFLEYRPCNDGIQVFRSDVNKYVGIIEEDKEAKNIDGIIFRNKKEYDEYNKKWNLKDRWEES